MFALDAHVHFHRIEDAAATLDAAVRNFESVGSRCGQWRGALLLAQAARERVFESIAAGARVVGWTFEQDPAEPETLHAIADDGRRIGIVNGRQIRAACGLEVLALGSSGHEPADGLRFCELAEAVAATRAVLVVPWGFGKWFGLRGIAVRRTVEALGPHRVFIGDNGGRISGLPAPRLLRELTRRGFRVLPGSDPFPFGQDCRRVGRFGLLVPFEPPGAAFWQSLRSTLLTRDTTTRVYGDGIGPFRFVANNIGIQLRNRLGVAAR
jgi:hypothetical protein